MTDALPGRPQMTLGGDFEDSTPFLGVIMIDEWVQAEYDGVSYWAWHLAVKPIDFNVKTEDHFMHRKYRHSLRKNSGMGAAREAMRTLFPGEMRLGEGDLLGKTAIWQFKAMEFGINKDTKEPMRTEVMIPIRLADAEEMRRAETRGGDGPTVPIDDSAVFIDDLDQETLDNVLAIIQGKTEEELEMAVVRSKSLPKTVKQALLTGGLLEKLVNAHHVTLSDGRYNAA
jgi:hypothetical protein